MDDSISPTKLPVGHLPYVVNYTYDELFALKKIGGNQEAAFGSYVSSAPEEVDMVDAYWDGGSVYNNTVLKKTFAMKWPSAASSIPTTTPVYMQLSLTTTANGGGYVGKMYRATTTWTEASTSAPTPSADYIDINCPSNNTQYTFDIPLSWYDIWYDGDYDANFGVVVIGTGGEFHSSSGVLGYGTGADGNIVITGTVDIKDVACSAGTYNPEGNIYINATNFTINAGATLTATAWGDGTDNKKGIIYIECQGKFTNNGTIDLAGKGGAGGASSSPGEFPGVGNGKDMGTYGVDEIPVTTWSNLYGSGGRGGGGRSGWSYDGSSAGHVINGMSGGTVSTTWTAGSPGGAGGGALRIRAAAIDNTSGRIKVDGVAAARAGGDRPATGGGGSGGTCFLEARQYVYLGTGCTALGGVTDAYVHADGSYGRIYVVSPIITGTTTPNYKTNS